MICQEVKKAAAAKVAEVKRLAEEEKKRAEEEVKRHEAAAAAALDTADKVGTAKEDKEDAAAEKMCVCVCVFSFFLFLKQCVCHRRIDDDHMIMYLVSML